VFVGHDDQLRERNSARRVTCYGDGWGLLTSCNAEDGKGRKEEVLGEHGEEDVMGIMLFTRTSRRQLSSAQLNDSMRAMRCQQSSRRRLLRRTILCVLSSLSWMDGWMLLWWWEDGEENRVDVLRSDTEFV
jgi:hypothetical protein